MLAVVLAVTVMQAPRVQPVRLSYASAARYDLKLASPGGANQAHSLASWKLPVSPQLQIYRSAMLNVQNDEAPAVLAASDLLAEMGESTERRTITAAWGEVFDGLEVKADAEGGPLNKLAAGVKGKLDATIALMPKRSAKMGGAAFNNAEKRVSAPDIASDEFFTGLLHETRHAWYAKEEREGRIRLFHVRAVARPNRVLVPNINSYPDYLSFEELSTFPKTLRHLATLENTELAKKRYWYMIDTMRTAAHLVEEAQLRKGQTQDVGDGLALGMRNAELYFPYTSKPEEDMALRWKLLNQMIGENIDPLKAYKAAVDAGDWKAARAHASKMVANVAKAEKAWLKRR